MLSIHNAGKPLSLGCPAAAAHTVWWKVKQAANVCIKNGWWLCKPV